MFTKHRNSRRTADQALARIKERRAEETIEAASIAPFVIAALLALAIVVVFATAARAMPNMSRLEGFWLYRGVTATLTGNGFALQGRACSDAATQHCTEVYVHESGVPRVDIAVRDAGDGTPRRVYRVVCVAGCAGLDWSDILQ